MPEDVIDTLAHECFTHNPDGSVHIERYGTVTQEEVANMNAQDQEELKIFVDSQIDRYHQEQYFKQHGDMYRG